MSSLPHLICSAPAQPSRAKARPLRNGPDLDLPGTDPELSCLKRTAERFANITEATNLTCPTQIQANEARPRRHLHPFETNTFNATQVSQADGMQSASTTPTSAGACPPGGGTRRPPDLSGARRVGGARPDCAAPAQDFLTWNSKFWLPSAMPPLTNWWRIHAEATAAGSVAVPTQILTRSLLAQAARRFEGPGCSSRTFRRSAIRPWKLLMPPCIYRVSGMTWWHAWPRDLSVALDPCLGAGWLCGDENY